MRSDLNGARRLYAEAVGIASAVADPRILDALATVPRETHLGPPPWSVQVSAALQYPVPADEPQRVLHNLAIESQGRLHAAPAALTLCLKVLEPAPGGRFLVLGDDAQTSYAQALLRHLVGEQGCIDGVDPGDPVAAGKAADALPGPAPGELPRYDGLLLLDGCSRPPLPLLALLRPAGRAVFGLRGALPSATYWAVVRPESGTRWLACPLMGQDLPASPRYWQADEAALLDAAAHRLPAVNSLCLDHGDGTDLLLLGDDWALSTRSASLPVTGN